MRLVVDARMMGAGNTRGIGRYIKEMTDHIRPLLTKNDEMVLIDAKIPWYSIAEQWRMPRMISQYEPDILWVPHWNVPLLYRGPLVITIHDLLLMHQPASAKASTRSPVISWLKRLGYNLVLSNAISRASTIFVPTKSVANDLIYFFPKSRSKIAITGEGLSTLSSPQIPNPKFQVSSYLLYVGSAYPHKRLDLLVDAWAELSKKHPELTLVITGKDDIFLSRIKMMVKNNRVDRVLFVGSVDDQELSVLYANAAAFVFPSSFEGFGLPPIEALAKGTPVIVSDIPVMREVLPEDGVFFFKSEEKDGMISAIEAVLADLPKAKSEAARGGQTVRERHQWEDAAKRTLKLIISHAAS